MGEERFSEAWRTWRRRTDLDEYDTRWDRLAAAGEHVHGEADLVRAYTPRRVLDAGCGTGRVAIELARHGIDVVGVDLDGELLARARRRAPELVWIECDLAELDAAVLNAHPTDVPFDVPFDVVVMAGNVLPFVDPGRRREVVRRCAALLAPGGRLIGGATLASGGPTVEELDEWCREAGLELERRTAGWSGEPWPDDGVGATYAVSVHRAVASA